MSERRHVSYSVKQASADTHLRDDDRDGDVERADDADVLFRHPRNSALVRSDHYQTVMRRHAR